MTLGGCGAKYAVLVASEKFRGVPTLKQHRMVNAALKEEVAAMHALRVFTEVPETA